jgi:hypothetical protein
MLSKRFHNSLFAALVAIVATLCAFSNAAKAQTIDQSFVNAYFLDNGGRGAYAFGFGYDVALSIATVSGSSVTLQPNTHLYETGDPAAWRDNGGAGPGGGKWVEISVFDNEFYPASGEEFTQTFTGCAVSNTLASPYSSIAFIRVFDAGFNLIDERIANANGTFDLSIPVDNAIDVNVQVGFMTSGPNANPADLESLGSVGISIGAPCAASGPGGDGLTKIPVLPIWALALLAGVLGLVGARVAGRHSR